MSIINDNPEPIKLAAHLSIFVNLIPFGGLIVVFIILAFSRDENYEVHEEAKKAANWQINMMLLGFVVFILTFLTFGFLGFILYPLLALISSLFPIIAAIRTYNGNVYQYPFSFNFLS